MNGKPAQNVGIQYFCVIVLRYIDMIDENAVLHAVLLDSI